MVSRIASGKDSLTAENIQILGATAGFTAVSSEEMGLPPDQTLYQPAQRRAEIKDLMPPAAKDVSQPLSWDDKETLRANSQDLAHKARDAFRDACNSLDSDRSEMSYLAMRSLLEELWTHAKSRDMPFRDLLAMLDAATRHRSIAEFSKDQRNVLHRAFGDLPRWLLTEESVDAIIEQFARLEIDISAPLRETTAKRLRIIVEEAD
jgi:hypothetical protein